jgi:hypothetical protein
MNEPGAPMASPRTKCPCCGFRTVKARGEEIWPVCFWGGGRRVNRCSSTRMIGRTDKGMHGIE